MAFELGLERTETHGEGVVGTPAEVYSVSRGVEALGIVNGCSKWQEDNRKGRAGGRS